MDDCRDWDTNQLECDRRRTVRNEMKKIFGHCMMFLMTFALPVSGHMTYPNYTIINSVRCYLGQLVHDSVRRSHPIRPGPSSPTRHWGLRHGDTTAVPMQGRHLR